MSWGSYTEVYSFNINQVQTEKAGWKANHNLNVTDTN